MKPEDFLIIASVVALATLTLGVAIFSFKTAPKPKIIRLKPSISPYIKKYSGTNIEVTLKDGQKVRISSYKYNMTITKVEKEKQ